MTSSTGPTNKSARPGRAVGGFSLLELILVLLILSLGAALTAPALGRFSRNRQVLDGAAHLLALIQYAQDQAAGKGVSYRLYLDPPSGTYWLTSRQEGVFVRLGNEFGRTFSLPDTLTAAWNATPDVTQNGYIQFDPDGGHDVAVIRLTARDGSVVLIGCDSPAESYRISEPDLSQEIR